MEYEIRIENGLDESWSAWFDGMQIADEPDGVTVISGVVADQAALHGLLARVRDLGLHAAVRSTHRFAASKEGQP